MYISGYQRHPSRSKMIAAGRVALEAKTAGRVTLETLMRAALLTMAGRTII
jgi:hypothetical protein